MATRSIFLWALLLLCSAALFVQLSLGWSQRHHPFLVSPPSLNAMRETYGDQQRDLDHKQTRSLYKRIINETGQAWEAEARKAGASLSELAMGCTLIRWRSRLYARSRDGGTGGIVNDYALALRDAVVHGVLRHSFIALWDIPACLAMTPDLPCPSYAALRARKTDDDIVARCWSTSSFYDSSSVVDTKPDL